MCFVISNVTITDRDDIQFDRVVKKSEMSQMMTDKEYLMECKAKKSMSRRLMTDKNEE